MISVVRWKYIRTIQRDLLVLSLVFYRSDAGGCRRRRGRGGRQSVCRVELLLQASVATRCGRISARGTRSFCCGREAFWVGRVIPVRVSDVIATMSQMTSLQQPHTRAIIVKIPFYLIFNRQIP